MWLPRQGRPHPAADLGDDLSGGGFPRLPSPPLLGAGTPPPLPESKHREGSRRGPRTAASRCLDYRIRPGCPALDDEDAASDKGELAASVQIPPRRGCLLVTQQTTARQLRAPSTR
ncbi:hypothetical protein MTO96_019941 [Rhipicephalus appendiculatus]